MCVLCCILCICLCGCRTSDEFFQQLEDNQVTLSTIKASRHVKAFEKEVSHCSYYVVHCHTVHTHSCMDGYTQVDQWERTLSHILEVIEMTVQVQRQWMYLEVSL